MSDLLNGKVGGFITRHGFGIFVAVVLLGEVLGFNPYSPIRSALIAMQATAGEMAKHEQSTQETNAVLREIRDTLKQQQATQTQEKMILCLRQSRTDAEREACVKLYGGK